MGHLGQLSLPRGCIILRLSKSIGSIEGRDQGIWVRTVQLREKQEGQLMEQSNTLLMQSGLMNRTLTSY